VYDAALLIQLDVTKSAQNGELVDLYSLDHIDFNQPWWNQSLNDRISVHNRLYFTTSDFMLMDKQRTSILFFNRDMAEDFELGNLFDLARDGSWTIDKMEEMSQTVSRDLDGDGDMDQHDQFGTGYERYNVCVMAFAAGNVIAGKDENDIPVLSMNTPRMVSTVERIVEFCSKKDIFFFVQDYQSTYEGDFWGMSGDLFHDGRLLFCASFPQAFKDMSAKCKDEYGVVPYPKLDEEQEDYYTLSAQAMLITVPVTASNLEFTGFMLEALSAYSKYTTLPAYYEVACKTKYMYDADSADMLDITFNGLVYDLGQLYNWGGLFSILEVTIPSKLDNNFASLYAAAEEKAQTELEKTVEIYEDLI